MTTFLKQVLEKPHIHVSRMTMFVKSYARRRAEQGRRGLFQKPDAPLRLLEGTGEARRGDEGRILLSRRHGLQGRRGISLPEIGLLMNSKGAAAPTTQAIKRRLKEKFPTVGQSTVERASSTTRIVFQRRISRMLEIGRGWRAWTNTPRSKWLRERTYSKVKSCA
jgi:hypothetical protein